MKPDNTRAGLLYSLKYINLHIIGNLSPYNLQPSMERCIVQKRMIFLLSSWILLLGLCSLAQAADTLETADSDTVITEVRDTAIIDDFALAVQLFDDGDYSIAMDHFRAIIEEHPQTTQGIESRFYLGMVYRNLGQYENARMTLQTFALTFPDHRRAPDAWWNVADIYAEQERYTDAGLALERLFQFHPDHAIVPRAKLKASVYFENAGDRNKSDDYLRRIILRHSNSDVILDARLSFGGYRLDAGEYSHAADVFTRVIAEIPEQASDNRSRNMRAEAILGFARANHKMGILDKADNEYRRVIEHYENTLSFPNALLHRAELSKQQGEHLDAVDLFRRAQRATEGSEDEAKKLVARRSMLGIAESYNALGDYSSAGTFFDLYARQYAASASREELITIWQGVARSNEGMRNHIYAVEWWDRIIDVSAPDEVIEEAYIRSAMNHIAAGNYHDAADRLRSFSDRFNSPQAAEALYHLGQLYENQLNDPRRALTAYEELAYRFPESRFIDDAVFGQARMQLKLENDRNAYHIVSEFHQRFPGSALRADASQLKEELEIYYLQDRDGGFQSITMLMSEMIAGSPRGELAFQLGDIYLNKLKQYPEAARQFETALSMELSEDKKSRAEYLLAYSLYRIAQRDENRRSEILSKIRDLSDRSSRAPNSEAISYYYLNVLRDVSGPAEFINAAENYIDRFSRSEYVIPVRLALAETFEEIGEMTNAQNTYNRIVQQHQNHPEAGDAMIRLAQFHLAGNDERAAIDLLSTYIRRYDTGNHITHALKSAAEIHQKNGRYREAGEIYRQFVRNYYYHPDIIDIKKALAITFREDNRHRDAFGLFEDIIEHYATSYFTSTDIPDEILYNTALAAYRMGAKDRAIQYFEEYIVRDRVSDRAGIASLMLGELYSQRGQTQISDFHFSRANQIITAGRANKDIADLLYLNGRYEKAVPHLRAVASEADSDEVIKTYREREIIALIRSNNVDEGRRRIESFRSAFSDERNALAEFDFELAMRHFRARSYDNAAHAFQQFIQQHQRHDKVAYAHFYLGRTWEAVGRRSDARNKYEDIFERFPNSSIIPDVHLAYAGLLLRDNQFIEAIDHYRVIIEKASDDDGLMYYAIQNLAQAYEEIGFYEAALELTEDFIERFPNDETVVNKQVKIGTLYQRANLFERSIEKFHSLILYADRALETELRYYTGDSYHMMGNYNRAIAEFKTVTELDPRTTQLDWTATALYMAGQSYEQMGKPDDAIAMYQEIIDRRGIEGQYKAAARREIERVRSSMN